MNTAEILANSYVVTPGGERMSRMRRLFDAAGLDGSLLKEWRWCEIPGEGVLGDAVAQYSLVRFALETKMPFLVVFEDDATPCDGASEKLVKAFEERKPDTLCVSLGWSYDSDPGSGDERGEKRRVYGSHAYALFGEKAYRTYLEAWEKNGTSDIVLGGFRGSKMNPENLFAQFPRPGASMHLPGAWSADLVLEGLVNKELDDRYSKARAEFDKMESERAIHVAYAIDIQGAGATQFIDQLLVSLYSLRSSAALDDRIVVHMLYANIPADLMARANRMSNSRFRIEWNAIKPQDLAYMQSISNKKNVPGANIRTWSGIVFARLWIPLALPKVDRCIYLDNDTFIRKSLRPLWDLDLDGNLLGMAMGTVPEYGYNSGVMVFDCKAIRGENEKNGLYSKLADHLGQFGHTYYCPDQTTINRFFAGRIKEFGQEWNCPPRPVFNDRKRLVDAAIWHFYEGGKPVRTGVDEFGAACLEWNEWLRRADAEVGR